MLASLVCVLGRRVSVTSKLLYWAVGGWSYVGLRGWVPASEEVTLGQTRQAQLLIREYEPLARTEMQPTRVAELLANRSTGL